MIYHFKSLVLVRKGRAFYTTLYQEVFFGNPGGGGSLNNQISVLSYGVCIRVSGLVLKPNIYLTILSFGQ